MWGPGEEGAAAQGSCLTHLRLCLGGIELGLKLAQGALRAPLLQVRLCVRRGWGCQQTSLRMPPLLGLWSFPSQASAPTPSNGNTPKHIPGATCTPRPASPHGIGPS